MALLDNALAPVVAFQRTIHSHAHAGDAGQRGEAIFDLAIERGQAIDGIARAGRIEMQHVAVGSGDAEVLMLQVGERFGHQNGSGEQDQGERGLKYDQSFLRQRRAVARGAVHAAQRLGRLCVRRQPRRTRAKENAGDQRDQKGKAKDGQRWTGVDGHVVRVGKCERKNGVRAGIGNGQSSQSADAAQQHALGENLADDAAAPCAQGHAHGDVGAPRGGARQQQVGDVGAGDEQHDGGENHQHLQTLARLLLQVLNAAAAG